MTQLSVNGFGGFAIDASYLNTLAADYLLPNIVGRGTISRHDTSNSEQTISVSYGFDTGMSPLGLGYTSMEVILNTNATYYTNVSESVIGGSEPTHGVGYAPSLVAPTPEPGSVILLIIGAATLGVVGWQRHARGRHA